MSEDNVGAVFGSYDDAPDGQAWFSRYKNLLHRYHHQRAKREACTFWAGCGAIRADVFREVGGFDVKTYEIPSIEDIELGYRIAETGRRILVEPRLQGKHLKVWTIRNSLSTDIFCRALPWARLMISREGLTNDLNTSSTERLRAGLAGIAVVVGAGAAVLAGAVAAGIGCFWCLAFVANLDLARTMAGHGGPWFAVKCVLYHQFYYVYSASIYVWCLFEYHVLGQKQKLRVTRN